MYAGKSDQTRTNRMAPNDPQHKPADDYSVLGPAETLEEPGQH